MTVNPVYRKAVAITVSNTVDFVPQGTSDGLCSAIYCGAAGNVVVVFQDGSTGTFTVVAGQILPMQAKRVNSTNTTVTVGSMLALYNL